MTDKISLLDIPTNYQLTKQAHEDLLQGILYKVNDSGELSPAEAFAICDTLEKIGAAGKKNFRANINSGDIAFGTEITITGGNPAIDYDSDTVIKDLKEQIKARQKVLQAAMETNIAETETGEIVQKPKMKLSNQSVTVKYK